MRPKTPFAIHCEEILFELEFDKRYYAYIKDRPRTQRLAGEPYRDEARATLRKAGLEPRYNKLEKFFSCFTRHGEYRFKLNVCFAGSTLEMMMFVEKGKELGGGEFTVLAKDLGARRDPGFVPNPAYPKVPYADIAQMNEAIQFGVSWFRDFERAFLDKPPGHAPTAARD